MTFRDHIIKIFSTKGRQGLSEWAQAHLISNAFKADPDSPTLFERADVTRWLISELDRANLEPFKLFLEAGWVPASNEFSHCLNSLWKTTLRAHSTSSTEAWSLLFSQNTPAHIYQVLKDSKVTIEAAVLRDVFVLNLDPDLTFDTVLATMSPHDIHGILYRESNLMYPHLLSYVRANLDKYDPLVVLPEQLWYLISHERWVALARRNYYSFQHPLLWVLEHRPLWFDDVLRAFKSMPVSVSTANHFIRHLLSRSLSQLQDNPHLRKLPVASSITVASAKEYLDQIAKANYLGVKLTIELQSHWLNSPHYLDSLVGWIDSIYKHKLPWDLAAAMLPSFRFLVENALPRVAQWDGFLTWGLSQPNNKFASKTIFFLAAEHQVALLSPLYQQGIIQQFIPDVAGILIMADASELLRDWLSKHPVKVSKLNEYVDRAIGVHAMRCIALLQELGGKATEEALQRAVFSKDLEMVRVIANPTTVAHYQQSLHIWAFTNDSFSIFELLNTVEAINQNTYKRLTGYVSFFRPQNPPKLVVVSP